MKRIKVFVDAIIESIKAVETPEKKKEQLEEARAFAPTILNGVWLKLANITIDILEATIKTS